MEPFIPASQPVTGPYICPVSSAPKVGIVHVPKSAGTALRLHLSSLTNLYTGPAYHEIASFPRRHVRGLSERERTAMITVEDARRLFRTHDMIVAHASADFFRAAGADHVVAIVREPRARLMSLYREWQAASQETLAGLGLRGRDIARATGGGFSSFLRRSRLSGQTHGAVASYVSGFRAWSRPTHSALDRAFWSDDLDGLIRHLISISAIPEGSPVEVGQSRVGATRGTRERLDGVALRRLSGAVRRDSAMLAMLVAGGKLEHRSAARLDDDFIRAAGRLGLVLPERITHADGEST